MNNEQALNFHQVHAKTGLSRTTIWNLEKAGRFPKRRKYGNRAVRWLSTEIDKWLKDMEVVDIAS